MALAWVSSATASDATGSAVTGTLGVIAAGQLVVLTICDDSAGATSITSVTDNLGNTYAKVPIAAGTSSVLLNAASTQQWSAGADPAHPLIAGTLSAITVAWNTAATGRVTAAAQYFNGFAGTPTLDQNLGGTGSSTSASPGTTSATAQAAELIVIGAGHAGATSAFSLGAGFTNLSTVNIINAAVAQESKVVSATGTQTGAITIGALRAWGAIISTWYDAVTTTTTTTTAGGGTPSNLFFPFIR